MKHNRFEATSLGLNSKTLPIVGGVSIAFFVNDRAKGGCDEDAQLSTRPAWEKVHLSKVSEKSEDWKDGISQARQGVCASCRRQVA